MRNCQGPESRGGAHGMGRDERELSRVMEMFHILIVVGVNPCQNSFKLHTYK